MLIIHEPSEVINYNPLEELLQGVYDQAAS